MVDGGAGVEKHATIGEGVGRHIEDSHDEGPFAEFERAGAEAPGEAGPAGEGHIEKRTAVEAEFRH